MQSNCRKILHTECISLLLHNCQCRIKLKHVWGSNVLIKRFCHFATVYLIHPVFRDIHCVCEQLFVLPTDLSCWWLSPTSSERTKKPKTFVSVILLSSLPNTSLTQSSGKLWVSMWFSVKYDSSVSSRISSLHCAHEG